MTKKKIQRNEGGRYEPGLHYSCFGPVIDSLPEDEEVKTRLDADGFLKTLLGGPLVMPAFPTIISAIEAREEGVGFQTSSDRRQFSLTSHAKAKKAHLLSRGYTQFSPGDGGPQYLFNNKTGHALVYSARAKKFVNLESSTD